jgi:hypothetical protein
VLVACTLMLAGLAFAAVWMRLGVAVRRRVFESIVIGSVAVVATLVSTRATSSWDTSENRANSFPEADEEALSRVRGRLRIEAHLAPEDPRRVDLERQSISKLRRVLPGLRVEYVSSTSVGLFEQTAEHYGEVWYELDGRRIMNRATTAEGVLETIYAVAGIMPPAESGTSVFRGHPLPAAPRYAAAIFYGVWPALVVGAAIVARRRNR